MRLKVLIILFGCGLLGCTTQKNSYTKTDDASSPLEAITPAPAPIIDMPVALPLNPLVPAPIPGGGGGSQGAIRPTKNNNKDHRNPDNRVFCGNGVQEPDGRAQNCPFDIYGTTYDSLSGRSNHVGFRLMNGGNS